MTYFKDLSPYEYFPGEPEVKNVGWFSKDRREVSLGEGYLCSSLIINRGSSTGGLSAHQFMPMLGVYIIAFT
jgi:hypothetical protein